MGKFYEDSVMCMIKYLVFFSRVFQFFPTMKTTMSVHFTIKEWIFSRMNKKKHEDKYNTEKNRANNCRPDCLPPSSSKYVLSQIKNKRNMKPDRIWNENNIFTRKSQLGIICNFIGIAGNKKKRTFPLLCHCTQYINLKRTFYIFSSAILVWSNNTKIPPSARALCIFALPLFRCCAVFVFRKNGLHFIWLNGRCAITILFLRWGSSLCMHIACGEKQ